MYYTMPFVKSQHFFEISFLFFSFLTVVKCVNICYNIYIKLFYARTAAKGENMQNDSENTAAREKTSAGYDLLEMFVLVAAFILILFFFFVRQTVVDGGSMDDTLANNDRLFVLDLFYTPERGDIVVFQSRETNRAYPLVKRVIAVGGDKICIMPDGVYVNGECENYGYISIPQYSYTNNIAIKIGIEYTVPEGKVFVLGDHRNNSADSREFGFVDERTILGKVVLRIMPLSKFGVVE